MAVQVVPPSTLARLDKTAFGAVTSAVVKPVIASVKVKVTVAVSPIFNAVSLIVMADASAGRTVSTVTESCVAARLPLPALSVKAPAATLKVAVVVLLVAGVKVAE